MPNIAVNSWFMEPRLTTQSYFHDRALSVLSSRPSYDNVGNYFISQALTEILRFDKAYVFDTSVLNEAKIEFINSNCKFLIIRGATLLYEKALAKFLPWNVISRIKIPILMIGYGIPHSDLDRIRNELSESSVHSLRHIHEQCPGSVVRGEITSDFLRSLGIKNAYPLGCPTVYWSLQPEVSIKPPIWGTIGWNYREYLYSPGNEEALRKRQFAVLEECYKRAHDITVFLQDMAEVDLFRYYFVDKQYRRTYYVTQERHDSAAFSVINYREEDIEQMKRQIYARYTPFTSPEFLDVILEKLFFSNDVIDYKNAYKSLDFVLGCRLHGCIMALNHGIPAYLYIYDKRTKELWDLLELPQGDLTCKSPVPDISALDYAPFERKYKRLYREFRQFLEDNEVPHNMK